VYVEACLMDLSRLSASDRLVGLTAAVVTVTAVISAANGWGSILVLAALAGIGAIGVIVAPHLAPTARLPGSKGSLLVILGAVALLSWVPPLIVWLTWIVEQLAAFNTIQFLVGFVSSAILAWTGWVAFSAEGGMLQLGAPPRSTTPTETSPEPAAPATKSEPES
jgi:hypothetical protein